MSKNDERRLTRLQKAIDRHVKRADYLREVEKEVRFSEIEATEQANAFRGRFMAELGVVFENPEKAFTTWERQEWQVSNLTFKDRSISEVGEKTQEAFEKNLVIDGLKLRGRRILGRDNALRQAAKMSLEKLGELRTSWLEAEKRAGGYREVKKSLENDITRWSRRQLGLQNRRAEIFETMMEHEREAIRQRETERSPDRADRTKERGPGLGR
jgi:hypothetical protein